MAFDLGFCICMVLLIVKVDIQQKAVDLRGFNPRPKSGLRHIAYTCSRPVRVASGHMQQPNPHILRVSKHRGFAGVEQFNTGKFSAVIFASRTASTPRDIC